MKRFMLFGVLLAMAILLFITVQGAKVLGIIDMSASVSPNWENSWNATTSSGTALYKISIDPKSEYGANVFEVTFEDDIFASVGTASLMPDSPSDWVLSMDGIHLTAESTTDVLAPGENPPLSFLVNYALHSADQYYQASGSGWAWNEGGPWEQTVGGALKNTTDLTDLAFGDTSTLHVPEPATMLLLGSGLVGLAGLGRKKFFKKSATSNPNVK